MDGGGPYAGSKEQWRQTAQSAVAFDILLDSVFKVFHLADEPFRTIVFHHAHEHPRWKQLAGNLRSLRKRNLHMNAQFSIAANRIDYTFCLKPRSGLLFPPEMGLDQQFKFRKPPQLGTMTRHQP